MRGGRRFGQLLGDTELVGTAAHLGPHFIGGDAAFVPQHDQVVEQIGALADDTARAVAHRFESDLAGLLDQFLRDLAPTRSEQTRGAGIVSFAHAVERVVKASDFRRIGPDFCTIARKYRLYGGVVPYQGSHVPSLHSQVGDVPTRAERRDCP